MAPLFAGQTVGDIAGFAAMTATSNFSSTLSNIMVVEITSTGDAASASDPLLEGEAAGFTLTVTDELGNSAIFDAGSVVVAYDALVTQTTGNEAALDINPAIPDSFVLTITINGSAGYDRTTGDDPFLL